MKDLKIETKRGVLLDGVLFTADGGADTVLICITGIHGRSAMPLCSQRTSTRTPSTTTSATRFPPRASTSSTPRQRELIRQLYDSGHADEMLPFLLMGWVECTVGTAYDWVHSGLLNNVHTSPDGDPSGFLRNINSHMPTAAHNHLLFIERTGHTYQQKHQEVADEILQLIRDWREVVKH